ncbi:hypothetical protein D3C80_2132310 [compost metagenome]
MFNKRLELGNDIPFENVGFLEAVRRQRFLELGTQLALEFARDIHHHPPLRAMPFKIFSI